jgi:predicted short-subunit dehydrogenase-like oxidoreductase (DUF2520 family)
MLVGPGRAGMSLALAARTAGHTLTGVMARDAASAVVAAESLETGVVELGAELPPSDLLLIAVRDGAIAPVADAIAPSATACRAAVHLSGLVPVSALDALAGGGLAVGSFHPLQSLPTPEAGAARIGDAWVGVTTAHEALRAQLYALAESLGAHGFDLPDAAKATYHAAAAAAANFPLAALTMASDLFAAARVPWAAARPLVETVVANAFEMGPRPALTGPVARGDVATVASQLDAVHRDAPEWLPDFASFVQALAGLTGRAEAFEDLLAQWRPQGEE